MRSVISKSLVGTRRAYQTCGGCGHERIRHLAKGTGRCVKVDVLASTHDTLGFIHNDIRRCDCPAFTERKD